MESETKKYLWVFGNAVQDITVEVDTERMVRELGNFKEMPIHLGEQGPEIDVGLSFVTKIGSNKFAVKLDLQKIEPTANNRYVLEGGKKYTLNGDIVQVNNGLSEPSVFLPYENLSWGGGGANVVTFLRALAPNPDLIPIKYTDIAMSRTLRHILHHLQKICKDIGAVCPVTQNQDCTVANLAENLYQSNPIQAEDVTANIAKIASDYAPERSLEVYLASLPVESVLYRPEKPSFRRNWVFSHFRSAYREVDNKIILRGNPSELPESEENSIGNLLKDHISNVGAIVLNSLKDASLFRAAYSFFTEAYKKDNNVVAILAMTEPMARFTEWMMEKREDNIFPPFILVFNETEAYNFAQRFNNDLKPFMKEDGFPDIKMFAETALTILRQFDLGKPPRIYVTLGPRGSLGVDGTGNVVYVSSFSKRGANIYDTNACGDAYCSAIALLEWAIRHGNTNQRNVANIDFRRCANPGSEEMLYFMAVATATAYCRATNRRGRVYPAEIKDLLQHIHLASQILPSAQALAELKDERRPHCIDENFRLREPAEARHVTVTSQLNSLLG